MIFKEICSRKSFGFVVFILVIQVFFVVIPSNGQDIKSHSDSIPVERNYFIQREFQFRTSGNDTILDGTYLLVLKPFLQDSIFARWYDYERKQVLFKDNVKEGPFLQKTVSFYPDISRLDPEGDYLKIPYRGRRTHTQGQFNGNQPSGQWFFTQAEQNYTEATDTLSTLIAFFNTEGMLDQEFRIHNQEEQQWITGSFNNNGSFSDTLEVQSGGEREPVLSFNFEDGLLTSIRMPGGAPLQPDYINSNEGLSFREQPLDSLYTKILSYYLQDLSSAERNRVLEPLNTVFQSFKGLTGGNSQLGSYLPGGTNIPLPTVKLPVYEPDRKEEELIQQTYNRLFLLYTQVDSLLDMPAFSLNRFVDQDLAALYAKGKLIRERIDRHRIFFKALSGPLLEHINPEWFLERRLSEINRQDTVTYTYNDSLYQEPVDFSFESEGLSPYEQYQSYLSRLEELYAEISRQSMRSMSRLNLGTRMEEGEERIATLAEEIEQLADTLKLNLYNHEISSAFKQAFVDFKEHQLLRYANLDPQDRMAEAESLVECLEKVKAELENADRLARKESLVDESYIERRLNPYTYTEMNVRRYERLFEAYRDILVPYLVQNIRTAGTCEGFLQSVDKLEILQDFMLNALEGNPGRLDRRARNQNNPEALIRRLGIPLS